MHQQDKELTKKWVVAMKRDDFIPNEISRLCTSHFKPNDYLFSNSKKLKPNAVPSLFDFPAHRAVRGINLQEEKIIS